MAFLLLVSAGFAGSREQIQTSELTDRSLHGLEVLDQANTLLAHLSDAETGQRGYLLTGAPSYLAPYDEAVRALPADLARLCGLTTANRDQQDSLRTLAPLMAAKLDELRSTIELRRRGNSEAALRVVAENSDKATMDRIRAVIGHLRDGARTRLEQRLAARRTQLAQVRELIALATVLGATVAGGSMLGLNRQTRRRLLAEQAVREHRQRLQVTLRSIGDGVMCVNAVGAITFMNPVAEQLTGWPLADAHKRPLQEVFRIVNEETRAQVENPVLRVLREGVVVGLANHTALIARDGQETPIDDSGAPILDTDGERLGAVLVFRDIAERRRVERERERVVRAEAAQAEAAKVEAELRAARVRAEAANRAKDEFLAVLSHELRSPLNAMLGWVTLLKRGTLTDGKKIRAIEVLERNVHAQTQLVDDLLDVSRIISGKLVIEEDAVDLAAVVRASVDDARPAAEAKSIELASFLEPLPGLVRGDERRLRQVLGNLLTNAVKFTPRAGSVRVTLTGQDEESSIEVTDTGVGIAPEFLPHVFDRFQQADATSTRHHGGLGLGLSIARMLAELHGGRIEARSEGLGKGATFILRLPVRAAPHGPPAPSLEPVDGQGALAGLKVVLVDDEGDTREALSLAFEQSGAVVYACSSAGEALAVVGQMVPDVIVSDLGMPGESGHELIKKLRARGGVDIPAIALTGFASREDREAALRSGFDDHVAKPVSPDVLLARVYQAWRRGHTSTS